MLLVQQQILSQGGVFVSNVGPAQSSNVAPEQFLHELEAITLDIAVVAARLQQIQRKITDLQASALSPGRSVALSPNRRAS
jgi:hypothetical protein